MKILYEVYINIIDKKKSSLTKDQQSQLLQITKMRGLNYFYYKYGYCYIQDETATKLCQIIF